MLHDKRMAELDRLRNIMSPGRYNMDEVLWQSTYNEFDALRDQILERSDRVTAKWYARNASRVTNAPNLSSKVSDIIKGNSVRYRTDSGILNSSVQEERFGAKVILDRYIQPNQLKELLDSGATHEQILGELRTQVKGMPPLVTPPPTTLTSSAPVVSVDAPPKVTPPQVTTRPPVLPRPMVTPSNAPTIGMTTMPAPTPLSQPPPLSNMPIESIQPTPKVTASTGRRVRTTREELDIQTRWNIYRDKQFQKSLDDVLDKDVYNAKVLQAELRGKNAKATVARLVRKQKERAEYKASEAAKKAMNDKMNQVTNKVRADKASMGSTTKMAEEVSSVAKIESAGLFSREGKLASQFFKNKGPLLKVGAIAAGAWIVLASLNSAVKTVTSIGADDNPPNYVSNVYNRIENERYSPMPQARRYVNPNSKINTTGLNQRLSSNRIGHHVYGNARSQRDLQNLYNQ
jgi:hypothetical protein